MMWVLAAAAAFPAAAALLPGTYTNEEQVYFAREAGKPAPPWTGLRIEAEGDGFRVRTVDAFGVPGAEDQLLRVREGETITTISTGACFRDYARVAAGLTIVNSRGRCGGPATTTTITQQGLALTMADGTAIEMQRARAWTCWASIPRAAKKPDGQADWWFKPGMLLHDAGGRVKAMTDEAVPQVFTLRMRNVAWPSGPNQPSLVLYVHGDDQDKAVGYGWADPGAKRVGINLRTVQASCSLVTP